MNETALITNEADLPGEVSEFATRPASRAGERAQFTQASMDYRRIEKAICYLQSHYLEQPSLRKIASAVHMSEFHFQRVFTRWAGISPKRFLQFLTIEHAKQQLAESRAVLETALDSGLSGPGRLHDLFVSVEAVTPGEFKCRGSGLQVAYGFHETPFGSCLIGTTERGICWLSFTDGFGRAQPLDEMKAYWEAATFAQSSSTTAPVVGQIFGSWTHGERSPVGVFLAGTNFQIKVWQALLKIPAGARLSYEGIGKIVGCPGAARAIGNAVARNYIAFLIPCHRVIRSNGLLGGYRWGEPRKQAMNVWEACRAGQT